MITKCEAWDLEAGEQFSLNYDFEGAWPVATFVEDQVDVVIVDADLESGANVRFELPGDERVYVWRYKVAA